MGERSELKYKVRCDACKKFRMVRRSEWKRKPRFCGRKCYGTGRRMGIVKRGNTAFGAHKTNLSSKYQMLAGLDDDSLDKKLRESFLKAHPVETFSDMSDAKRYLMRTLYENHGCTYQIINYAFTTATSMIESAVNF